MSNFQKGQNIISKFIDIQKMENIEIQDGVSICSEFNLNINELNVQQLLANPIYRRFYNILTNDKNQNPIRKNLIRELYFLMKITPIMKPELQMDYLKKLQQWYNLNDHKKTQLGSGGLKTLFQQCMGRRHDSKKVSIMRPQSGGQWNKNVTSFLRPYTATRQRPLNQRPDSYKSKFGGSSTKATTKLQSCQEINLRQCALSIDEQFQASQDFLNKHRTVHSESEPVYEQLFNIIKKAQIFPIAEANENFLEIDEQNQVFFQRDKQQFLQNLQKKNQIKKTQDFQDLEQINLQNSTNQPNILQEQSDQGQDSEQQIQQDVIEQKKIFTKDLQRQNFANKKKLDDFQFLSATENKQDQIVLKRLNNKYSHLSQNKMVDYSRNDNQLLRNYVNYTRAKSAVKTELNRKLQSKRMLSSQSQQKLTLKTGKKPINQRVYSAVGERKSIKKQTYNVKPQNFHDWSRVHTKQNKENYARPLTAAGRYNQRKQLDQKYRRPIQAFKKFNKNSISVAQIKFQNQRKLLTHYDNFFSKEKINPIDDIYVQKHNEEVLQEMEKIKRKLGAVNKNYLSTDSLMKALYINAYQDVSSCKTIGFGKQGENQCKKDLTDWKNRDLFYNMISNGAKKKMKKKPRKLKLKKK